MRRSSAPTLEDGSPHVLPCYLHGSFALAVGVAGALGGGASCGVSDIPVLEVSADGGGVGLDPAPSSDAGASCGHEGQLCCDAGCAEDGSFCSIDHSCRPARPTDVGTPCTSGHDCQSGLCTYVQPFDASTGADPPSPTVCSEPCWGASDCLPGWACWTPSAGPVVLEPTGPGTCVCTPVPETCDGKDDNCDGRIDEEPGASVSCTATSGLPSKCLDAQCTCIDRCDGGCVNLTDDPKNCGACGKACAVGLQVCADSECVCGNGICPIPDGGLGDSGYIVPEGGPGGSPAACFNTRSDPANCGGCGVACAYTCDGGACLPLLLATLSVDVDAAAGGLAPLGALASNGSDVFILTAANGGAIEECSVTGCDQNPATVATGLNNTNNVGSAGLLALGGTWVYWPGQTAIKDVTVTSPTVSVFAHPAHSSVYAVATNATQVFWSDEDLGILSCAIGATCASPTLLVPISSLPAAPQALAADDLYVYWMDADGNVFSSPFEGASPLLVAAGDDAGPLDYLMAIVAWAGRVYYVDSETGQLATAEGGIASSAAVYAAAYPIALATDGVSVYWTDGYSISRCVVGAACAAPTVINGDTTATSLAVDVASIYWIDDGESNSGVPQVWEFHK